MLQFIRSFTHKIRNATVYKKFYSWNKKCYKPYKYIMRNKDGSLVGLEFNGYQHNSDHVEPVTLLLGSFVLKN